MAAFQLPGGDRLVQVNAAEVQFPASWPVATSNDSSDGFGLDEDLSATGDSGGPVFINGTIAGVVTFSTGLIEADYNDEFDRSWGEEGFATRVSSFRDFITTATNRQAVFVPEPGLHISSISIFAVLALIAGSKPGPQWISSGSP